MSQTIYRIRHKVTGLWKMGGSWSRWGKKGKVWIGTGPLKLHLNQYHVGDSGKGAWRAAVAADVENWEVIEYRLMETEVKKVSASSLYDEKK